MSKFARAQVPLDLELRVRRQRRDEACVIEHRQRIVTRLRNLGYTHVTLDLAGFRSGSMNEGLAGAKQVASVIQL